MKLNDKAIKAIQPSDKITKYFDGAGLALLVRPSGVKTWTYFYRYDGKQKKLTLGQYPQLCLKDARIARQEARFLIDRGIDPVQKKQKDKLYNTKNTFQEIAEDWFALYREDHSNQSIKIYRSILDTHILSKIGQIPIDDISRLQLVGLVKDNTIFKATKDRSKNKGRIAASTAIRMCCCLGMIFQYAINIGRLEYSVATKLSTVLPDPEFNNHRTVIDKEELKKLLQAIRTPSHSSTSVWYFLNIMPYVFVRNTELRGAKWEEFDLTVGEWHIPGVRMKDKKINKQSRPPHFVPLSRQVIELLSELKDNSNSDYVFPSVYNKNRCISDVAPLIALKRFEIHQTVHGFRTIASTYLHEFNYPTHIIEAQMAHKDSNKVRAVYNKAEYKEERTKMMQDWADYLDNLVDQKLG